MNKENGLLRSARNDEHEGARNDAVVIVHDPVRQIQNEWHHIKVSAEDMKRHALQLGAILLNVEAELNGTKAGRGSCGLGLKGWIEENLPDEISVAYQSLMRWKQAAQSLMSQARLDATEAVALLTRGEAADVPTPSVKKFNEIMESKSLKQLVFDFSEAKKAPGRKPGMNEESYKQMKKTPAQNAEFAWAKVLVAVHPTTADMAAILPVSYAEEALAKLEPLVFALKARVKEG